MLSPYCVSWQTVFYCYNQLPFLFLIQNKQKSWWLLFFTHHSLQNNRLFTKLQCPFFRLWLVFNLAELLRSAVKTSWLCDVPWYFTLCICNIVVYSSRWLLFINWDGIFHGLQNIKEGRGHEFITFWHLVSNANHSSCQLDLFKSSKFLGVKCFLTVSPLNSLFYWEK